MGVTSKNGVSTKHHTPLSPVPVTHPYLDHPGCFGFAHRGGVKVAPENTMAAFQHSVDLGYRYVETDVHLSADGVLYAFHDDDLSRIAGIDTAISELQSDQVDLIRLGQNQHIPRLEELFYTWPDLKINIEPKSDAAVDPLINAIGLPQILARVCIGSFVDRRIQRCRSVFGRDVCTSMGEKESAAFRAFSYGLIDHYHIEANCAQLPVKVGNIPLVDERLIAAAEALGIGIHVWTINERIEMHRLFDLGVTAIMTDYLTDLRQVMIQRNIW